MGKPSPSNIGLPSRFIEREKTRGTEISKYPEEKKSHEIPLVSDERTGKRLNRIYPGLQDLNIGLFEDNRIPWNRKPKNVTAVYVKSKNTIEDS
jgi:hypothetical protein